MDQKREAGGRGNGLLLILIGTATNVGKVALTACNWDNSDKQGASHLPIKYRIRTTIRTMLSYIVSHFVGALQVTFTLTSCAPTFLSSVFTSPR